MLTATGKRGGQKGVSAMDKVIKPIETIYNGYRFRSRLEARWAVFFDAIRLKYQYEPEGFCREFDSGEKIRYLPDFYLPEYDLYVEVKPSLTKLLEDEKKLSWMIDWDGPVANGIIILGQIPNITPKSLLSVPMFLVLKHNEGIVSEGITFGFDSIIRSNLDLFRNMVVYASAPELGISNFPENLYVLRKEFPCYFKEGQGYVWNVDHCYIPYEAYDKARQARFEHGESPNA